MIDLRVFVAVVDSGGFTAAATRLGYTKQTVSRRIRELEERLGVRLIERSTRAIRLTDVGTRLHVVALRVLASVSEVTELVRTARSQPAGLLRIASPPFFARRFLSPIVEGFLHDHPDVSIQLMHGLQNEDLVTEGFDLAFRLGPLRDSTAVARRLGEAELRCVAAPSHLARLGQPLTPATLRDHPMIAYGLVAEQSDRVRYTFHGEDESYALEARGRLQVNDGRSALSACLAGLGAAVLPALLVEPYLTDGTLTRLLPDWSLDRVEVFLVRSTRRGPDATIRAFLDRVMAQDWTRLLR